MTISRQKPCTVSDLLTGSAPIDLIMVRTNHPYGGDTLLGYCCWDGQELKSLDGDDYYMDETVLRYEWSDVGPVKLTYWIHSEWIGGIYEKA